LNDVNNKKKIIISRDVYFLEPSFQSSSSYDSTINVNNDSVLINVENDVNSLEPSFETVSTNDSTNIIKNKSVLINLETEDNVNIQEEQNSEDEFVETDMDDTYTPLVSEDQVEEESDSFLSCSNSSVIEQQQLLRPQRENRGKLPKRYDTFEMYYTDTINLPEPKTVQEVMLRPGKELWIAAMKEELKAI